MSVVDRKVVEVAMFSQLGPRLWAIKVCALEWAVASRVGQR